MELSGLQIFKYLPGAKKTEHANCKKCGFPTCMTFALKLAKNTTNMELCPHMNDELKSLLIQNSKVAQKEVRLGVEHKTIIGGENVMFRHDKTFINPTALVVALDTDENDFNQALKRVLDFEITRISQTYKVDGVLLKGSKITDELRKMIEQKGVSTVTKEEIKAFNIFEIKEKSFSHTVEKLVSTRRKAVIKKEENSSNPVMIYFEKQENLLELASRAGFFICKYANLLIFENFDEALFSTLMTLRQNIFTDPQKSLQVEAKIYEFNNPDENSMIFLTTNFALTYFAVANELETLSIPSYLIVTPSEGMSVLTAWSAEKFTAQLVAKTIEKFELKQKVNTRKIIIPGLLAHMREEIQEEVGDFEVIVGTNEAYLIKDFVKSL